MESWQIALTVLIGVSSICVIVLTIYISMFLYSAYKLFKSANKTCTMINCELQPVLDDLKETVSGVNSIVKAADTKVKFINGALTGILGATGILGGKLKDVFNGVVQGFRAGMKLTKRK